MLSHEDNELMCRVEPGYPMHDAFKRYWLIAGLSEDHPAPDSNPKRSTILGEDYVLFRDSAGKMGCLRERCCHRGASLCLARVEEGGIRCIYHGWKFDTDGTVLDMPNTTDDRFKSRYRQQAFPVRERGGLIWVYLGPPEEEPPPPNYYWLDLPKEKYWLAPTIFKSNYTQVLDGGADSSHLSILHKNALSRTLDDADVVRHRLLQDTAPVFDRVATEFGQFTVAIRRTPGPGGEPIETAKTSAFIAPSTVLVTPGTLDSATWAVATPVNSYETILYIGLFDRTWTSEQQRCESRAFMSLDPQTQERLGIAREHAERPNRFGRENNWMQDREAMRRSSFTGLTLFIPEDIAMAESVGAIYDRSEEHLVPADTAIVGIRRILIEMARDVQAGRKPIGIRSSVDTAKIGCWEARLDGNAHWTKVLIPQEFREQAGAPRRPKDVEA